MYELSTFYNRIGMEQKRTIQKYLIEILIVFQLWYYTVCECVCRKGMWCVWVCVHKDIALHASAFNLSSNRVLPLEINFKTKILFFCM